MKYTQKKYKNGLTLVTIPMQDNPTITFFVASKTGSHNETKRINGISHFLEHMCFKGTIKRPTAKIITGELDAIGAYNNAFTSHEYTAYYAKADKSHVDTILDVVSDIYLNPQIPQIELEKERGVILQEYKMYLDDLRGLAEDVWLDHLYGDTQAGWRIIGTPETIAKLSRKDFLNYHKKQYCAENTVVVVSGNINEKEIQKKIGKLFKTIHSEKPLAAKPVKEKQNEPQIKIHYKDSDQSHMILGVRAYPAGDKRNLVLRVLRSVLSGGMSARLFQKMREDLGICYYVYADSDLSRYHGDFHVAAGVDQNRLDIAVSAIIAELKLLANERISEEELSKVKEGLVGRLNLSLESSDDLGRFVLSRLAVDQDIKTPEKIKDEVMSVTAEEIQTVAKELFVDKALNLVVVGKHKNEKELKKLLTFK